MPYSKKILGLLGPSIATPFPNHYKQGKSEGFESSSSVHHFVPIGEFKLELQSGNVQFGSNSTIFRAVRPYKLTDDLEKNNTAPLLCYFKLCASFRSHWWIQTGVTVRKRLNGVVTLTFDLSPLPFARTSLVITPEKFMMIPWWEHSQKGVTDGQTNRWTDWLNHS